ncbi:hypothetical protein [uncultured Aquimonas sp.]|jgi:hypothetical protein|uniref:hypothetical protein n=1 Tax=uncultured Aquimonas sp. TaxID=385483 RepID=UPI00086E475A|nr:hypothetical protein [uncultured Aquimonas sp.]ODU42799.1 MAG: hypothetical protein ABS96_26240 [Xanthomonadaceae bacterium SCN 69-123]
MKLKQILFWGACALSIGLGMGVAVAQSVPDLRCQSCYTIFMQCLAQCDAENGEGGCYRTCTRQRTTCESLFCP